MPSPSYAQNKEHIYKWRAENREIHNESTSRSMRKYRLKLKTWKEIKFEFLNILII